MNKIHPLGFPTENPTFQQTNVKQKIKRNQTQGVGFVWSLKMARRKFTSNEDKIRIMEKFHALRASGVGAVPAAKELGFKDPQSIYHFISVLKSKGLVGGTRGKAVALNRSESKIEFTDVSSSKKNRSGRSRLGNGDVVADAMMDFLNSARKLWELSSRAS